MPIRLSLKLITFCTGFLFFKTRRHDVSALPSASRFLGRFTTTCSRLSRSGDT